MDHVVHHHEPSNIGSEVAEAVEDRYEDTEVVIPANVKVHVHCTRHIGNGNVQSATCTKIRTEIDISECVVIITNEGR